MEEKSLIAANRSCAVRADGMSLDVSGCLQLALRLGGLFKGRGLVHVAPACEIRDDYSSAIASGAFYAFRTLKIPRQKLLVEEFEFNFARVESMEDIATEVIARATAVAIAALAERELPPSPKERWYYTPLIRKAGPDLFGGSHPQAAETLQLAQDLAENPADPPAVH